MYRRYINPGLARVQGIIGVDKIWARGEGAYLWDTDGEPYLDLLSGYSVFNLGRDHPVVRRAIEEVLDLQRPNLVKMDCPLLAGLLAEALVQRMPPGLDTVFFANDGSDSVDTALKFARAATGRPRVLYLDHAFHGLMLGTLSVNGGHQFRKGFGPLMPGFDNVPMNDAQALKKELRKGDVAALVAEPIQGKGVYVPEDGFLLEAQRLCRTHGTLRLTLPSVAREAGGARLLRLAGRPPPLAAAYASMRPVSRNVASTSLGSVGGFLPTA